MQLRIATRAAAIRLCCWPGVSVATPGALGVSIHQGLGGRLPAPSRSAAMKCPNRSDRSLSAGGRPSELTVSCGQAQPRRAAPGLPHVGL